MRRRVFAIVAAGLLLLSATPAAAVWWNPLSWFDDAAESVGKSTSKQGVAEGIKLLGKGGDLNESEWEEGPSLEEQRAVIEEANGGVKPAVDPLDDIRPVEEGSVYDDLREAHEEHGDRFELAPGRAEQDDDFVIESQE